MDEFELRKFERHLILDIQTKALLQKPSMEIYKKEISKPYLRSKEQKIMFLVVTKWTRTLVSGARFLRG